MLTALLGGAISGTSTNAQSSLTQATNNVIGQTTGIDMTAVSNALGTVTQVLDVVGLGGFVDSTVGAVISNGFDFSCWGSKYVPADGTKWAQKDFPKIYSLTIGRGLTTENVQTFADVLSWNYRQGIHFGNKMNTCSKKTLHGYARASIQFRDKVLAELGDKIQILGDETTSRSHKALFVTADTHFDTYDKDYVTKKVVVVKNGASAMSQADAVAVANQTASDLVFPNPNETAGPKGIVLPELTIEPKKPEDKSSFQWWWLLLALLFIKK